MPGYRDLPEHFSGRIAEGVRHAEVLQRAGANEDAVHLLETALELCTATSPEIPGWLCGRLATLYRTLKRYDDEVRLLERYRDSHARSDEARNRFDARLSKARAIADRKSRLDTMVLSSVRASVRRRASVAPLTSVNGEPDLPPGQLVELREALLAAALARDSERLMPALRGICAAAREFDYPPERMVMNIRTIWEDTTPPEGIDRTAWRMLYRESLTRSLAMYFHEPER